MADGTYNAGSPANGSCFPKDRVRFALEDRAQDLFRLAWGEPVKAGAKDWRARGNDARSMVMSGPKRGQWFDHKAGLSGDILDFVAVELCGLSRAKDDFPRVLREGAAFCGLADGAALDLEALTARKAAQRAAEALQEAREAQRTAELLAALQARALPLDGSPAAAYLASRGIDTLPPGWSYLPPVPGLGVPSPHRHALVAWAIDESGHVTGGQRILILEDGSKAPESPRKPAFGSYGGRPARIPARAPGGPLCIAEGPETAAAIAQATGFEVWAVYGASNWARAPAPLDRKVILCPDRDAPGAPAAEAFNKACEVLAAQGVNLWIAYAPEPKGSKRDLADTLKDQGPEAVAKAVKEAVKRGGKGRFVGKGAIPLDDPAPLPDFLSLDEVGGKIEAKISDFLERAAQWSEAKAAWKAYCDALDRFEAGKRKREPKQPSLPDWFVLDAPPALAIAASPGSGKTTAALKALARFDVRRFGGDAVIHAPSLKLSEQIAADLRELGSGNHVTRGRLAKDPATAGKTMCDRPELVKALGAARKGIYPSACESEDLMGNSHKCPHFHGCRYLGQWRGLDDAPVVRAEAHNYLALPGDGSGRKVGLRVIDESVWQQFTHVADLPVDRWIRPRTFSLMKGKQDAIAGAAADATAAAREVLAALQKGESPLSLRYSPEDFEAFAEVEIERLSLTTPPSESTEKLLAELSAITADEPEARKRASVWQILAEAKRQGLAATERLSLMQDVPAPKTGEKRDVLRLRWFKAPPRDVPALLLDADITPGILARLYPGAELAEFTLRPNAEVLQVTDRTFSKSATLDRRASDGSITESKIGIRRELVQLVQAEVMRDRLDGERGVLVLTNKALVQAMFEDAGHNFGNMSKDEAAAFMQGTPLHGARWLWFGPGALGKNDWQGLGTVIAIGRNELPVQDLEDVCLAFWADTGEPLKRVQPDEKGRVMRPREARPVTMADGSAYGLETAIHPDPRGQEIEAQFRELNTRQGVERLRLARADRPKRVILASAVPIPGFPVDRLVSFDELMPNRLERAIAEVFLRGGAVLRLSAAGLAEDAPQTFPTENAAKLWERESGKEKVNGVEPLIRYSITGATPLNPVQCRLRIQGQRGPKPTPALVIAPHGDPRAAAEAQLGPLAMFEVVQQPEAVSPNDGKISLNDGKVAEPESPVATLKPPEKPPKRLVWIPEGQQIKSRLLAHYVRARREGRILLHRPDAPVPWLLPWMPPRQASGGAFSAGVI